MAGEWIKMRTNLWDDPRVSQVCDLTDASEATVVGGLYWLWSTADEHTETGLLPGLSLTAIDRKSGVKGLGQALVSVGWLEESDEGVTIVHFEEHNGASAKTRAQNAKRQSKKRCNADVTDIQEIRHAQTVTGALPREEKRREEVINTPIPPDGGEVEPLKKTKGAIELKTYLAECKQKGVKSIPEGDPVFDYAAKVGIPTEFLQLQWLEFRERYTLPGAKRYKSWPTVFRKSVQGNWFKLWFVGQDDQYALTTVGQQAKRNHRDAA